MQAIKALLKQRKFMAMLLGIVSSIITMILTHFLGDEAAQLLGQQIALLIMSGVSIYAGGQALADYGDESYSKNGSIVKLKTDNEELKKLIEDKIKESK